MIEPIDTAIRRLRKEIAELEWSGGDARPLRLIVDSLLEAQARGERWYVLF